MNGAKLKTEKTTDIPVYNLKDGQLAVITSWAICPSKRGEVVQRYRNTLITVGKDSGRAYPTVLENLDEDYRVRVLEPGELIEVQ